MNKTIIFTQIPRTGGETIEKIFKRNNFNFLRLYIKNISIEEPLMKGKDIYFKGFSNNKIHDEVAKFFGKKIIIAGHFPYHNSYKNYDLITFIRNPIDRIISHYYFYISNIHYGINLKNINNYTMERYLKELGSNIMYKMIGDNINKYKFIGILERYKESIERFENIFNVEIEKPYEICGINPCNKPGIENVDKDLIIKYNKKDIELYERLSGENIL